MFLWLSLLTGVIYPVLITIAVQFSMKERADGSLIRSRNKIIGAKLIGQKFSTDKYFWGRPSAVDYNPLPSGGSNLGPTSKELEKLVAHRKSAFTSTTTPIPSDLLFASGSGLDPHISSTAAHFQVDRIIKARGLKEPEQINTLTKMILENTTPSYLRIFGKPCVNVLMLNIALDEVFSKHE